MWAKRSSTQEGGKLGYCPQRRSLSEVGIEVLSRTVKTCYAKQHSSITVPLYVEQPVLDLEVSMSSYLEYVREQSSAADKQQAVLAHSILMALAGREFDIIQHQRLVHRRNA